MAETLTRDDIVRMLRGAIARILAGHETLSKLDSVIGDGDHGTTMVRAMGIIEKSVAESAAPDLKGMLNDVGWAVMGVDGGAAGPLIGSLLRPLLRSFSRCSWPHRRRLWRKPCLAFCHQASVAAS